jgi:chromatin structure-remodeling complex protein RSC7
MMYPATMQPTSARIGQVTGSTTQSPNFPHLDPKIPRNFLITDIRMEMPPSGIAPASYDVPFRTAPAYRQASAQADFLASFQGLSSVPDEIKDLLPEECRKSFDAAVTQEEGWFARWGDEKTVKSRGQPLIDKDIMP